MTLDIFAGLSDEQKDAIRSLRGPVKIIAGAGSGKTLTITRRIVNGIVSGEYEPGQVMALSFTRRASLELRSRLIDHGVRGVYSGTFHQAALAQLKFFWEAFHGKSPGRVMRNKINLLHDAAEAMKLQFSEELLRQVASEVEWMKQNCYDLDEYERCSRKIPDLKQVQSLMLAYEELKTKRKLLDFEDILILTVGMLSAQPRAIARIRDRFRVFLIDEFQDVSPLQFELLRLWLGRRRDLCVVGDPNQCIYSFAGARKDYLVQFSEYFPGAREVNLSRNYRSLPEIVNLANQIVGVAYSSGVASLSDSHTKQPVISWYVFDNSNREMHFIAQRLIGNKKSCAVLYRTAAQGERLARYLHRLGVLYRSQESRIFHDIDVVQLVFKRIIERAAGCDLAVIDLVNDVVSGIFPTPPEPLTNEYDGWVALQALRLHAERFVGDVSAFASHLLEMKRSGREPEIPFATLATLHATKGLEWDTVYIMGVNEGLIPHRTGDESEERRLFYVGVTRSRRNLIFTSTRDSSRYLAELNLQPLYVV